MLAYYMLQHQWSHSPSLQFTLSSGSLAGIFPPQGHFILSWPQVLQNTHTGLHRASKKPQRRVKVENRLRCSVQRREVKWGTNSVSMILHFHILLQAQLKKEFIIQLTGARDKPQRPPRAHTDTHTHTHQAGQSISELHPARDMTCGLTWGLREVKY